MNDPAIHLLFDSPALRERRERVFLVFAGLFLGTMTMLNILGISRFIRLWSFDYELASGESWEIVFAVAVSVGALPHPLTFLCTNSARTVWVLGSASRLVGDSRPPATSRAVAWRCGDLQRCDRSDPQ